MNEEIAKHKLPEQRKSGHFPFSPSARYKKDLTERIAMRLKDESKL